MSEAAVSHYSRRDENEILKHLSCLRGVAQLVARMVRDHKVVGSNPVASTTSKLDAFCPHLHFMQMRAFYIGFSFSQKVIRYFLGALFFKLSLSALYRKRRKAIVPSAVPFLEKNV